MIHLPNYDLRCVKCERDYNIRASMAEKSEKKIPCPDCGSFELETIFKTPPAYVKNSGAAQCPQRNICGGCRHAG